MAPSRPSAASARPPTRSAATARMPTSNIVRSKASCSMCGTRSPTFSITTSSASLPKRQEDGGPMRIAKWTGLGLLALALNPFGLPAPEARTEVRELILAAYSVPKEAYETRIIPAFQKHWRQKTGQEVKIRSSYGASGAQARAIIGGFEADVTALSLESDVDQVAKAGLITHNWRKGPHKGIIATSVVAFGVRKG